MTLRRCDSLPSRLREALVPTEAKPKEPPIKIPDSNTVPNFNCIPDRNQIIATWNSLHSEVKNIKNGFTPRIDEADHEVENQETLSTTHHFITDFKCNKSNVRRKTTYDTRHFGVRSHDASFCTRRGQTTVEGGTSMAKRRTLLHRLLPWKTQECDCQERYIPKYRAAPKLRNEDLLCTCGASANKYRPSNKNKPRAERGRSKSVGYEAAREVTQFRRCASAGATVGAETAAALRARAALTLARRYYPEGGWGWTITVVGTIVQVLSHGLQLGGGTGAIACTAAVKYRVPPLYTHETPSSPQHSTSNMQVIQTPPPRPLVFASPLSQERQPATPSPQSSPATPSPPATPAPSAPSAPTTPERRRRTPAPRASATPPSTRRSARLMSPATPQSAASPDRPRLRARRRRAPTPFERAASEFAAVELRRLELEESRLRLQNERDLRALEVEHERNQVFRSIVNIAQAWLDYYRSRDNTEPLNNE